MYCEKFWINDISVLYKINNVSKFIPTYTMTKIEKLNAITRLCIIAIILFLINGKNDWIYIIIVIILSTLVIYLYDKNKEDYTNTDTNTNTDTKTKTNTDTNIEIGRFDQNGDIIYDDNSTDLSSISDKDSSCNCRSPTKDNPFMNGSVEDIGKYSPIACNSDDEDIKSQITEKFNEDLFKNTTDLFEHKNAERQFYTVPVPNGIPDTIKFANWTYKSKRSCKTEQKDCLPYDMTHSNNYF
jgi:hypothetical protein